MRARSKPSSRLPQPRDKLITSLSNVHVKHARSLSSRKNRTAYHQFAVEGARVIEEAERAGLTPALVFFEPDSLSPHAANILERFRDRGLESHPVGHQVFKSLAQTETPQGIIAVYTMPNIPVPANPGFIVVLDAVRDPGNVGTLLRTAWAVGADAVVLAPGTADLFNPKIVRAAMGAHFFLPIASESWDRVGMRLRDFPRVFLADAHQGQAYTTADWKRPCALIVGGEAQGPSEEAQALATGRVKIPMPGNVESLNVAVAAGILMFQAVRPTRS